MCRFHDSSLTPCGQGSSSRLSPNEGRLTLIAIPAELHLSILSYADYHTLKALRETNRYFRNLIESRHLRRALKQLERRLVFPTPRILPCYDCLQLRSSPHFALEMRTGDYKYCGSFCYNRRCMSCSHTGKSPFIDRSRSEHFYFDNGCWIDCKICLTTRLCRDGEVGKSVACYRPPPLACDFCVKQQEAIWPSLMLADGEDVKGGLAKSPPSSATRKKMTLFRRKSKNPEVVVEEVSVKSSSPVVKGYERPTTSFLHKARQKFRKARQARDDGKWQGAAAQG